MEKTVLKIYKQISHTSTQVLFKNKQLMSISIIGGAGFVGTRLSNDLLKDTNKA